MVSILNGKALKIAIDALRAFRFDLDLGIEDIFLSKGVDRFNIAAISRC